MLNNFLIKYLVEIFFFLFLIQFIILNNINFKKFDNIILFNNNFFLFKIFYLIQFIYFFIILKLFILINNLNILNNLLNYFLINNSLNLIYSINSLNLLFIFLTILLITFCLLWDSSILFKKIFFKINNFNNLKISLIALIFLQFFLINLFFCENIFYFFIFSEASLIPTFYLIGINGSLLRKVYAAYIFIIYSSLGSLFLLIAIIYIYINCESFLFLIIKKYNWSYFEIFFLLNLLSIGFFFKIPIWPLHHWLIEAHVQAPTSGSVILAGLLLKMGTYGILKWVILLFDKFNFYFIFIIIILSFLSTIISSLSAIVQTDLKKLIAYSSIAHMAYSILGLFSFNFLGLIASVGLMIAHGFIASGLFFCIGILYDRYGFKSITSYSGLSILMPNYSSLFLLLILCNVSFPGSLNFITEFNILISLSQFSFLIFCLFSFLTYFSSIYSFLIILKIFYGIPNFKNIQNLKYYSDLNFFEFFILTNIILIIILLGLFPNGFNYLILLNFFN
jgi:NADH-quinone oxidoreductase subunit M